jgi:triacylglycerol esterase/lipase EstA (alpha/beta hydrolase family)
MLRKPVTPSAAYRMLRDNLGSLRKVYLKGNDIARRGDLGTRQETVLLLHGFMQTRAVWEVMEDRLRYDGFGVFSFNLGGLFFRFNSRPVDALAEIIAEKIETISDRYGLDRFHVIGHSKGGLIARSYVQHFGGDRRVKSLTTLGTPHHGTPTAAIGVWLMGGGVLSRSPLQMLPGSRLVKLLSRDTFPPHIPMSSIYSRHDLICPYWCSVLRPKPGETSMKNMQVKNVGHTALTYDPGVYILVRKELEAAAKLWSEREGTPYTERQPTFY